MTQSPPMDGLEVEVKNFGPIAEAKFDLRPFTVFIGPSNSGKSYLSILIYALHRALSKEYARADEVRRSYWEFPKEHFKELRDWLNKSFGPTRKVSSVGSNPTSAWENFELPQEISKLICSTPKLNSGAGVAAINREIKRCFGTKSIQPLIRRVGSKRAGASRKATVTLTRNIRSCQGSIKSLTYSVELSAKMSGSSMNVSEGMPLCVWDPEHDSYVANLRDAVFSASMNNLMARLGMQDMVNSKDFKDLFNHEGLKDLLNYEDVKDILNFKADAGGLLQGVGVNLINAVINNSFDPIGRPVHYLPADRGAVMHAHRIFVNAMMEHATRAGIDRSHGTPVLSGVLGDFLGQLIGINDRSSPPGQHGISSGSDRQGGVRKNCRRT